MPSIVPIVPPMLAALRPERGSQICPWLGGAAGRTRAAMPALAMRERAIGLACLVCTPLLVRHGGGASLVLMVALALASCASSIAGFAFGAIAGAMLFHLSADTVRVVQIMMICSIANQAAMTWDLRRTVDWRGIVPLIVAGAGGVGVGVWLLLHTARAHYVLALGIFLLAYGAYMLLREPVVVRGPRPVIDAVVALLSGVVGGAVGFPSAFVAPWCGMRGWDKARQRAVFQPFILSMQVLALLTISLVSGSAGHAGFDIANLLFVPASLIGTTVGLSFYRKLSDRQFSRVVNFALVVSGLGYMI